MGMSDELANRIRRSVAIHHAGLLRLAYAYVHSAPDAEDIVQEVFFSVFRLAPAFEDDAHEKAWLMRATVNRCKNLLKSGWFKNRASLPETLEALSGDQSELLGEVMALERMYRMPIHLFYYEGYSIKEIAEILGEKPATIGTRLMRGRELIKERMGGIRNV